jgi:hypothetical protein
MFEILHHCSHLIGCCGEPHPNFITFVLGHNEVIQLLRMKLRYEYIKDL